MKETNLQNNIKKSDMQRKNISDKEEKNNSKIELMERQVFQIDAKTNKVEEVNMDEILKKISKEKMIDGKIPDFTSSYTPANILSNLKNDSKAAEGAMVKVANSTYIPYIKVCRISWGGQSRGSGFMVASNLVLTAAHCFLDENGNVLPEWLCQPAYNYGPYRNCTSGWQRAYFGPYRTTGNYNDDWCVVELDWHMGNEVGWFGCTSYGNNPDYYDKYIYSIGYPTEPPYSEGECQYYSPGTIYSVTDGWFLSNCGCRPGMSGGPAMIWANDEAIGINQGIRTGDSTDVTLYTRACKIHAEIIDIILSYQ